MTLFQQTLTILAELLVLSLILERSLHFIFYFSLWRTFFRKQDKRIKSLKALIVLGIALWVCTIYNIDALARIVEPANISSFLGIIVTALVISGGSAGIHRTMIFIKTLSDKKIYPLNK